ncbi:MAG: Xaa-Pro dipeptidyl-peptidase, partial [Bacteroidota bacterium]
MKKFFFPYVLIVSFLSISFSAYGQPSEKAVPVFKDGEAQIVPAFEDSEKWIRHDLWVETTFDTDGDGKPDRMHVGVTRPYQTDTEG